jgi:hypothetical protein
VAHFTANFQELIERERQWFEILMLEDLVPA